VRWFTAAVREGGYSRAVRLETHQLNTEVRRPEADPHLDGFIRWRFRDTTVFGVRGEATLAGFAKVSREFLSDPTPHARKAKCSASVPDPTPTAFRTPMYAAKLSSNASSFGPIVNDASLTTLKNAASRELPIIWCRR
jgi:hypothetical protein